MSAAELKERLGAGGAALRHMLGLMIGLPDYDAYVRHRTAHHPGEPVMDRAQFVRDRQDRRYGKGASRCC